MENITLGDIGMFVAFMVALISGIAFLKKNLKDWITAAMKPELDPLHEKMDVLQNDLATLKDDRLRDNADAARRRILSFHGEILRGLLHSKEQFDGVLGDIDEYEKYCLTHPDYPNSRAVLAIMDIKTCYQKCTEKRSFLGISREPRIKMRRK